MDSSGRLVIPKEVRRRAGIQPGERLEVRYSDGRIEIEPASLPIRMERLGHLVIAVPEIDVQPLKSEVVELTRQAIMDERAGD